LEKDAKPQPGSKAPKEQRRERKDAMPEQARHAFDGLKAGAKAADIALFGRMVAEIENMNVAAACQVAHAISTNEVEIEVDFFTAVDDLQSAAKSGAGMLGIAEFNSSCFYRYSLLDTKQLGELNLAGDHALFKAAADAFLKASIFAIPAGKQSAMAAQNLPLYIRAIVRESGAPMSLANAFLSPIRPDRGIDLALASICKLETHDKNLARMYGNKGVRYDGASSVYPEHGTLTVQELLAQTGEVLA
jgi:CRISPR system Cascade subunit CasC